VWLIQLGRRPLPITSGRRSASHQRDLRARWDRGDRRGLVARPALNSAHVRGEAFDVARGPALTKMGQLAHYAGVRWGASFRDPVHFDLGND